MAVGKLQWRSNLNAVPVTSACIRDHTLGIFLPFSENQITIMIPRIAKRSYVSAVWLFGIIKQNYRHHYPFQSIFFTCIQAGICTGVKSILVAILEFFFRMLIFFSDWNKRIELNRIVSGFIDRVLWQNRPIDSFFPRAFRCFPRLSRFSPATETPRNTCSFSQLKLKTPIDRSLLIIEGKLNEKIPVLSRQFSYNWKWW